MKGIVTKSTGSWYRVLGTIGEWNGMQIKARLRGSLRLQKNNSTAPVVVGDIVKCCQNTMEEWVIDSVEKRKNYLVRKSTNLSKQKHIIAANIDTLYVVVTLMKPQTPLEFIDRMLVMAEAYGIEAKVVVNKIDTGYPTQEFLDIYKKAGYQVILTSATQKKGIEKLKKDLNGKTVLFSGNSGVGKSSLINAIDPTIDARTGEISQYHKKGKHTTTFSEIFTFAKGGLLIDTPGIKGFGLVDIQKEELWHYFPEMLKVGKKCGFYNCTHIHEPNCAVIKAVEKGKIALQRYDSYAKMMAEQQEGGSEAKKYR